MFIGALPVCRILDLPPWCLIGLSGVLRASSRNLQGFIVMVKKYVGIEKERLRFGRSSENRLENA